jgi:hypothetical protein
MRRMVLQHVARRECRGKMKAPDDEYIVRKKG